MNAAELAVLIRVSCGRLTVVLMVAVLPPVQLTGAPEQSGSVVPVGGITLAVLLSVDAADAPTEHVMINDWLPPLAMLAPVQVPVPVVPGAMVPTLKVPKDGV